MFWEEPVSRFGQFGGVSLLQSGFVASLTASRLYRAAPVGGLRRSGLGGRRLAPAVIFLLLFLLASSTVLSGRRSG